MIRARFRPAALLSLALLAAALAAAPARAADPVPVRAKLDTLQLPPDSEPAPEDSGLVLATRPLRLAVGEDGEWRRAPYGDDLITHPDPWLARHPAGGTNTTLVLDYDRVDLVRYGVKFEAQRPQTMLPRLGAMLAEASGRNRVLYGLQLEQPLLPTARFVLGVDASRRTDHGDLQQMDDFENSLLLLVAHEDWRDYFEREGVGAYLSWRVPDFSTVSVHARSDRYRSLASSRHVVSWWHTDRPLRANPAIDDGDAHRLVLRLERLARHTHRTRAGIYHWIEIEGAGGPLGGDFDYTRALADVRSVVRLSPGTSLALRAAGGSALNGALPAQRRFTLGGVDGLRAHPFDSFVGDRLALGQLEYNIGLRAFRNRALGGDPQVIVFADTGTAWDRATGGELASQRFAFDGGVGIGTADDDLRLSCAKDLRDPDSGVVVTLRLQRPF